MRDKPTSPPCADPTCRTVYGYMTTGDTRPSRLYGLCKSCHARHQRRGTLDQFRAPALKVSIVGTRHTKPLSQRRGEKALEIAARIARHEGTDGMDDGIITDPAWRVTVTESAAQAWLEAHPNQVMGISHAAQIPGWPNYALGHRAFPERRETAA
jgi:hypothetical protein